MKCTNCNKEIRDGAEDCPYCGRPTLKNEKKLFNFIIGGSIGYIGCLAIIAILTCLISLVMMILLIFELI